MEIDKLCISILHCNKWKRQICACNSMKTGNEGRWSVAPRLLYPMGNSPQYPWTRVLGWPKTQCGLKKKLLSLTRIRTLDGPAYISVTVVTLQYLNRAFFESILTLSFHTRMETQLPASVMRSYFSAGQWLESICSFSNFQWLNLSLRRKYLCWIIAHAFIVDMETL
jgi:hypothetical protein